MIRTILGSLALSVSLFASANASPSEYNEAIGSVTSIDGDVIVTRGTSTYSLSMADPVFIGDRVMTLSAASVTLEVENCTKELSEAEYATIDSEFCEALPFQVSADEPLGVASPGGPAASVGNGFNGGGGLAFAAATAAAVTASSNGGNTFASAAPISN